MDIDKQATPPKQVKALDNRTFGLIFAAIFAIIALFPLINSGGIRSWAAMVCGAFVATSLLIPSTLTPLNKLWAKFGMMMHKITNPLLMGLVFFLTVLPTGVILKVLGKDPMRRKLDKNADSYWIEREPGAITKESFDNQF